MMVINDMPIIAFDRIIEYLAISAGFYETIRLREVNRLFNTTITRCLFDTSLIDYFAPENRYTATQWSAPLMAHFLIGQAKKHGRDNGLLSAIHTALDAVNERLEHSSQIALLICEAAARTLGQKGCFSILGYSDENYPELYDFGEILEPEGRDDKVAHSLCAAVIAGHFEDVVERIESDHDSVHIVNRYFGRPIHLAALFGRIKIASYLARRGGADSLANMLANDRLSRYDIRRPFFIKRDDIRIRGTALRIACYEGHEKFVRELLGDTESRLSPALIPDKELELCVYAAGYSGNLSILKLVLSIAEERFPAENSSHLRERLFFIAAMTLNVEMLRWALNAGVDTNSYIGTNRRFNSQGEPSLIMFKHTALQYALMPGNQYRENRRQGRTIIGTVRYLLEEGADPNLTPDHKFPPSPMRAAIKLGIIPVAELLLKYGAEDDVYDHFIAAIYTGNIETVRYFFKRTRKGPPEERFGVREALNYTARHGPPEVLEFLITEAGLPVDDECVEHSPVYCAMQYSNEVTLEVLYRHGAKEVDPMLSSDESFWSNGSMPYRKCSKSVMGFFGLQEVGGCQGDGSCPASGCPKR